MTIIGGAIDPLALLFRGPWFQISGDYFQPLELEFDIKNIRIQFLYIYFENRGTITNRGSVVRPERPPLGTRLLHVAAHAEPI